MSNFEDVVRQIIRNVEHSSGDLSGLPLGQIRRMTQMTIDDLFRSTKKRKLNDAILAFTQNDISALSSVLLAKLEPQQAAVEMPVCVLGRNEFKRRGPQRKDVMIYSPALVPVAVSIGTGTGINFHPNPILPPHVPIVPDSDPNASMVPEPAEAPVPEWAYPDVAQYIPPPIPPWFANPFMPYPIVPVKRILKNYPFVGSTSYNKISWLLWHFQ